MTYSDYPQSSQFRFNLNVQFVWGYLRKHFPKVNLSGIDVNRVAEIVEDEINMIDLSVRPSINVLHIFRTVLKKDEIKELSCF